jgi:hypothetical protein
MRFETSAMTIPTLDNRTPEDTKIVLHHFGPDYYFDKIWIQGKNYGYEFPLPDAVKSRQRERMEPLSVAARYEAMPAETQPAAAENAAPPTQTASAPEPASQPVETAAAVPAGKPEQPPAQTAAPAPADTTTTAQNTAPIASDNSADRSMPETAAHWLAMLLGGGMLSGVGLALRRRR